MLKPMGSPSNNSPQKPDLLNPQKQKLYFILDDWSLNKSINAAQNGNNATSYYPLPTIIDLLARF